MGALTLKAFSDELREWELIEGEGFDPTDGFGTNLRLSIREQQIFLAEPNDPESPWVTDRGRLFFEGLFSSTQEESTIKWGDVFKDISELMYFLDHLHLSKKESSFLTFVFDSLSLESLSMLCLIKQACPLINIRQLKSNSVNNVDLEKDYTLSSNLTSKKLEKSTLCLLVNSNPRYEGSVLNLNLRQRFLKGNFKVFNASSLLDLTFPTISIGSNFSTIQAISEGTHFTCQDIKNAKVPTVVTNGHLAKRGDSAVIYQLLKHVFVLDKSWQGLNFLQPNINSLGIMTLNNFPSFSVEDFSKSKSIYMLNCKKSSNFKVLTELCLLQMFSNPSLAFVGNQSFDSLPSFFPLNKLACSKKYDFPSNMIFEDNETFLNTQGIYKRSVKFLQFKKGNKKSWQLLRKFFSNFKALSLLSSFKANKLVQYDAVNSFNFKNYVSFHYLATQTFTSLSFYLIKKTSPVSRIGCNTFKSLKCKVFHTKVQLWLDDFFLKNNEDSYSSSSSTLLNCSKISRTGSTNFF